jgi:colicin import membrane protein
MQVTLLIQLIKKGDVISVTVAESSGNAAFDQSAENAVKRAGRFPELNNLPDRVFEQNFRRLRLVFRPEDLRQ